MASPEGHEIAAQLPVLVLEFHNAVQQLLCQRPAPAVVNMFLTPIGAAHVRHFQSDTRKRMHMRD